MTSIHLLRGRRDLAKKLKSLMDLVVLQDGQNLVSGTQTPCKEGGVWALGWGGSVSVRWNAGVAVIANYDEF